MWNCAHPSNRQLSLQVVNSASPAFLHRFEWLDDSHIGALPSTWNHLVGYDEHEDPKLLHFTDGVPSISRYRYCEWASEWKKELIEMYQGDLVHDHLRV